MGHPRRCSILEVRRCASRSHTAMVLTPPYPHLHGLINIPSWPLFILAMRHGFERLFDNSNIAFCLSSMAKQVWCNMCNIKFQCFMRCPKRSSIYFTRYSEELSIRWDKKVDRLQIYSWTACIRNFMRIADQDETYFVIFRPTLNIIMRL